MKFKPDTYLLEPCDYLREGIGEALVEVRVAGVNEHRETYRLGRRDCRGSRRQYVIHRNGEMGNGPTVSENSGMHVRTLLGPGRSLFCLGDGTVRGRWKTPKPVMYWIEKSDRGIVAKKATNKGANLRSRWSEGSDPRGSRKILAHTIR